MVGWQVGWYEVSLKDGLLRQVVGRRAGNTANRSGDKYEGR